MLPYFFIALAPAIPALGETSTYRKPINSRPFLALFFVILTVFVGFRYEVGPDWAPYISIYEVAKRFPASVAIFRSEPAYMLINIVSAKLNGGIVLVNLVSAVIALWSIYRYCADVPRPWLATYVLTSFFLVAILMGLNRQGVAASIVFLAINQLKYGKGFRYFVLVLLAAAFHVSALIMLPLLFVVKSYGWIVNALLLCTVIFSILAYVFLFQATYIETTYAERNLHSSGSYFRFFFHVLAAVVFLLFWRRIKATAIEIKIYRVFSFAAIALLLLLPLSPSTTAVDRVAFYIIPLQVIVFSNLPNIVARKNRFFIPALVFVLTLYTFHILVWFLVGTNAEYFIPYGMSWFG